MQRLLLAATLRLVTEDYFSCSVISLNHQKLNKCSIDGKGKNKQQSPLIPLLPLFSIQSARHNCKCDHDQWQQGTKEEERSDDVFLEGGLFSLLTFRTPLPSLSSRLAPPTCAPLAAGRLFSPPDWPLRASITRASTYLPNV